MVYSALSGLVGTVGVASIVLSVFIVGLGVVLLVGRFGE